MGRDNLTLVQGTLDMLVLKSLEGGAAHGYAVASWIRDASEDALQIEDGALYTALHRMEKRGWLASEWGLSENNRRARFYALTREGRRQLKADQQTWGEYITAVSKVMSVELGGA